MYFASSVAMAALAAVVQGLIFQGQNEYEDPDVRAQDVQVERESLVTYHNPQNFLLEGGFVNNGDFAVMTAPAVRPGSHNVVGICEFNLKKPFRNLGNLTIFHGDASVLVRTRIAGPRLVNSGNLTIAQMGCDTTLPYWKPVDRYTSFDVSLLSTDILVNSGSIHLLGLRGYRMKVQIDVQGPLAKERDFHNVGTVSFYRAEWQPQGRLGGEGCIIVGPSAVLTLSDKIGNLALHVFYLYPADGETSTIMFHRVVGKAKSIKVVGFREHTFIRFLTSVRNFSYHDGELRFYKGEKILTVNIGPGYEQQDFIFDGVSITCLKDVPVTTPTQCKPHHESFVQEPVA